VEGAYAPEHVNVTGQRSDPDSLLSFMALLIRRYRESPELGWADLCILEQPYAHVLAHLAAVEDRRLVLVHNFSPDRVTVPLRIEDIYAGSRLVDLLQDGVTALDDDGRAEVALDGYGYRWLRVMGEGSRRLA
jgi:hypothetical protein